MTSAAHGPLPGTSYVLERLLGTGGSGEVFEATHVSLGKRVAIKLLSSEGDGDEALLDRLRAEARLLARISHPALVEVFDLGTTSDGRVFFAMDYVDGETAAALVARRGSLPTAIACDIMAQVLGGLAAAHAIGVVHRDLKPSNIMVGIDGRARLVDFGVARAVDEVTETGLVIGTPAYMAPEQILGRRVSPATDLYAAACTLFVLLTGAPPFSNDVLERHLRETPPTISERLDQPVSTELEALIAQALAKDPHDRPQSAEAMAADLRRIASPNDATITVLAPRPTRANVRELPTTFLGRARELSTIHETFARGGRLVSLVGPGGGGKTRLAKRYAALHVPDYAESGGTWFVGLEEARSVSDVVAKVARVLGTSLASGPDESSSVLQLGGFLAAQGATLLVLDNCEQATDEVAQIVAQWREVAPEARFLATSRERLGLAGEATCDVSPLSISESVALFVDRARLVRTDYVLGEDDVPIVEEIARALDGIPLAIELGAARMGIMSATSLRDRLGERFDLLATAERDAIPRQRTLEGAIDWSWSLLEPWEQAALAQCTVFRGGFTIEAAEAVVDVADHPNAPPVLDIVQRLRDKSLVYAQPSRDFPSEIRLGLYETIREFASAKLAVDEALERHAAYFSKRGLAWAEHADRGSPEHVRRLVLELDNLRAVHAHAVGRNLRQALQAADVLLVVLFARTTALSVQLELATAAIESAGDAEPELVGNILYHRAFMWSRLGRAEETQADAAALLALAARTANPVTAVQAHIRFGHYASIESRVEHAEAAVEAARRAGGVWQRRSLARLAAAHLDAGHHEIAERLFLEVIEAADAADDRKNSAYARTNLGILLMDRGDLEQAERAFEETLATMGHVAALAAIYRYNLANVRHERGDLDRAEREYRHLVANGSDHALVGAISRAALGALLASRDEIDEAARLLDDAERELARAGHYAVVVATHRGHLHLARARRAARQGDLAASERHRKLAERAREASEGQAVDDVRTARRLLECALDPGASDAADAWVVARDGAWFRRPHGWRVDVGSRAHAKLVLSALLRTRLDRPGNALSIDDVLHAGWPGERVLRRAAEARVYNIIKALRNAGLRELIVSREGGYALDPAAHVLGG